MLGFRLEKKTIVSRDAIAIAIYFVFMLLSCIYLSIKYQSLDKIYSVGLFRDLLYITVGTISAVSISYAIVGILELFYGSLFTIYSIKYYISDTSEEPSDDSLLGMIHTGAIPFIDDEYVDKLGYTVKCVKIDKKEYENICSMIADKKRVMEMEELARLMNQYEKDGVPKIYLGG
jgi:lipoprotein